MPAAFFSPVVLICIICDFANPINQAFRIIISAVASIPEQRGIYVFFLIFQAGRQVYNNGL